jgi:hypothetical protein
LYRGGNDIRSRRSINITRHQQENGRSCDVRCYPKADIAAYSITPPRARYSGPQEGHNRIEQAVPGRLAFQDHVITAFECHEFRAWNASRNRTPLIERHDCIVAAMKGGSGGALGARGVYVLPYVVVPYAYPVPYYPGYVPENYTYCDPNSGTYIDEDGARHLC